jgi:transposase
MISFRPMNEMDGRLLSHDAVEAIRIRAVKRVEAGESPEVVIKALGFHRSAIYTWLALDREGRLEALKARKAAGPAPKLSGEQLRRLYRIIVGNHPLQLGFEFALWTRAMIREVIREQFGVRLADVSAGRLLRKLGLSPQQPLHRAYQRDEQQVEDWRTQAYPEIQTLAKQEGATIYFGDEAGLRSDTHSGTTCAPSGQTPVIDSTGARVRLNMLSAVSAKGQLRFMTCEGGLNAERFVEFLKRLIYLAETPIFLILDGHPVHTSKRVKTYVDSTDGRLRLFILPPYSPHLNPDEWVWNWLKRHTLGKACMAGSDQFRVLVDRFLRSLQKLTHLIRGFFADPNLAYITQAQ